MLNVDQHAGSGDRLKTALEEARRCVQEAWPDGCPALDSLGRLDERLRMNRLQVAVLGQFKRGKSTFINALLGASLLPSAVVPATAIPTFIAWGPALRISVRYQGSRPADEICPTAPSEAQEALRQWVTEEGNPENHRGIARVDLRLPADILRGGLVVIDTPGIGSTLQHNTDAALQVLPECDAALFVLSADPPITQAELAYLTQVRRHAVRVFFILNKIDYLSRQEQAEALAFLQAALQPIRNGEPPPPIFALSARQALASTICRDEAAHRTSGLREIEQSVLRTLEREKFTALQASVRSKMLTILEQVQSDLALRVRALELPLDDLTLRSRKLQEFLNATVSERKAARDLLEGDRRRATADLESQAGQLRRDGSEHLSGVVAHAIAQNGGALDLAAAQQVLESAIPAFFESKLVGMAAAFHQSVEAMLVRHLRRADALIASVRQTAAAIFEVPAAPAAASEPFRLGTAPYWVTQGWSNLLIPSPASLLARVLPGRLRQSRVRRQIAAQVGTLVQQNVENLRWATLQGLNDTFRRFSGQLDQRLAETLVMTESVINIAVARCHAEEKQTIAEARHLRALAQRMAALRMQCGQPDGT